MTREENRARMPIVTAWVDMMRAEFGEVRVTYASENGLTLGKPLPVGFVAHPSPEHWNAKSSKKG